MKREVEIVALVYKSVDYLKFISEQLLSDLCKVKGWDVSVRIVANDATDEVLAAIAELDINVSIYSDKKYNDYYLNRVYRCWNFAVRTSPKENVCLVNSDMAFSYGWLKALLEVFETDPKVFIPTSRLVESGKLLSHESAIVKDFGRHPNEFKREAWEDFAAHNTSGALTSGGLFMPVVFERKRFMHGNGYPEGHIYEDGGFGSCNGNVVKSGDAYFFYDMLGLLFNMKHVTVHDSLVYHIQTGEMDEQI